jgi:hypothetical protein
MIKPAKKKPATKKAATLESKLITIRLTEREAEAISDSIDFCLSIQAAAAARAVNKIAQARARGK